MFGSRSGDQATPGNQEGPGRVDVRRAREHFVKEAELKSRHVFGPPRWCSPLEVVARGSKSGKLLLVRLDELCQTWCM